MPITVLGAGIIGLSVALRLREAGHTVGIVAATPPLKTTSGVAAALWYPYRAYPQDAVGRWAAVGFAVLSELAGDPCTGVRTRLGRELFRAPAPDPWWRVAVPSLRRLPADEVPAGYADAIELSVPVVDMSVHLVWLQDRLRALGVPIEQRHVTDVGELAAGADAVVNCTGLGARELCGDLGMVPVRGQVVVVEQIGLDRWTLDQSDARLVTYVVPRRDTIVLGGTAEPGDEDLTARPATAEALLARCAAVVPEIAGARVLAHRVGLRPGRPAVRLEVQELDDGPVVHCYGHGGAGVTLAYGCAQDVVGLLGRYA